MARRNNRASSGGTGYTAAPGVFSPVLPLVLLVSVLALVLLGFVMVYSASSIEAISEGRDPVGELVKQIAFAVIGVIGGFVIWKVIPYEKWTGGFLWAAWALAVVLLVLTATSGAAEHGAQRWLALGDSIGIQPSEFAKIVFVLMMARILFDFRNGRMDVKQMFVQIGIFVLFPLLFLYATQSDLGTTMICFFGILAVIWLGEVPLRTIVVILGVGLAFAAAASLVGYRQDRLFFLNPWDDGSGGLDEGYQLIHSFYAFSEGGLFGVGLGNSREKFLYLPFAETDFIFSIIGEELGLIGALGVVALFMVLLAAGLRIAREAPDNFGTMVAGGFAAMLVFQAFLNMGSAVGLLPTTGKPLPFISAGGSSLIASMWMVGFILAVARPRAAPSIYEQRRDDLRVVRMQPPGASAPRGRAPRGQARPGSRSARPKTGGPPTTQSRRR